MSSAILYVAIVAIWAGVLIPRWLRRDSSASSASSDRERAGGERATTEPEPVAEEPAEPASRSRHREDATPRRRPSVRPEGPAAARPEEPAAGGAALPRGGPRDQEHKKVLAARRRLLGMLLALVTGSGALAFTRLAAWWVVVPPVIMLLGFTALLREAAKADSERRELARTRTAAAAVRAAASRATAPAPAPAPAAPAQVPGAEVIDISASLTPGEEELYDQYADAKLRAVGDLAWALTGSASARGRPLVL